MRINTNYFVAALFVLTSSALYSNPQAHYLSWPNYFSQLHPKQAAINFSIGGFIAKQGEAQAIGIDGLIGDYFTLNSRVGSNVMLGFGYYGDLLRCDQVTLQLGLNAYYLARTQVYGNVVQEQLFNNLSYRYSVTNYPIYAASKVLFKNLVGHNDVTIDLGIGPNIINATDFNEHSLDGGVTIPENMFTNKTTTAFSLTTGLGIKLNTLLPVPCEVSYRFFYLGQASLPKNNDQVLNNLKTGNSYANALLFTIYA